ncbi:MAG: tetratricopeptide repeat protein [Candidatus Marinimicrobia bacterium]|nr:tetratricopeptide repeat protein [Candidatus Neomarinimicrobiota bacterium]
MNNTYLYIFVIIFTSYSRLPAQHKQNINAALKTAQMLERRGDADGALAIYSDLYIKNPRNHTVIRQLRTLYRKHRKYEEGIVFLRTQLKNQPNDIQTYIELGEFHFLNDEIKEAKSVWAAGINQFKDNRSYYRMMVSIYGRYNLDKELGRLLTIGRGKFGPTFLTYEAGTFYQSRQVYDKAMDEYLLNMKMDPRRIGMIQRSILNMSDDKDAVEIILNKLEKAAAEKPKVVLPILADLHFKQQNYIEAFTAYKTWTAMGQWNEKKWLTFANDLRKEREYIVAIDAYNFILKQTASSETAGKALLGLAKTFEDQVIPIHKSNLIPYFFDQNLFFEDPFQVNTAVSPVHLEASLEIYDSLLYSLPGSHLLAEAYFRLGEIQYRILQDFDRALGLFQSAQGKNPDNLLNQKIIIRITDVLIAQGKSENALELLNKVLLKQDQRALRQKRILVHFLTGDPDSTLTLIEAELSSIPPAEPSFNDLMELKDILTQYYRTNQLEEQKLFKHFLNAELLIRQRKTSEAIEELKFLVEQNPDAAISPLAILRQALLFQRIQRYDEALQLAHSLGETAMADRGIILSGQIYELHLGETEKALAAYMKILNEYPLSIFAEPVRYHIRKIQQTKS